MIFFIYSIFIYLAKILLFKYKTWFSRWNASKYWRYVNYAMIRFIYSQIYAKYFWQFIIYSSMKSVYDLIDDKMNNKNLFVGLLKKYFKYRVVYI